MEIKNILSQISKTLKSLMLIQKEHLSLEKQGLKESREALKVQKERLDIETDIKNIHRERLKVEKQAEKKDREDLKGFGVLRDKMIGKIGKDEQAVKDVLDFFGIKEPIDIESIKLDDDGKNK